MKIVSIEDQLKLLLKNNIKIEELEKIISKYINHIDYVKVFGSKEFEDYFLTNNLDYNQSLLLFDKFSNKCDFTFLGLYNYYFNSLKNYNNLLKLKESHINILDTAKEIERFLLIRIIDKTLLKYRNKELNSIIDFFILFHVENSNKLKNEFKSFIKTNYNSDTFSILIKEVQSFFEQIASNKLLKIHKSNYFQTSNINKQEILNLVEEARRTSTDLLAWIKPEEKIKIEEIFLPIDYRNLRKILCDFFNDVNDDLEEVTEQDIDIFFSDLLEVENFRYLDINLYILSKPSNKYFGDDIQFKLNSIIKDNKRLLLCLISIYRNSLMKNSKDKKHFRQFGDLIARYFRIDIKQSTLKNILFNEQMTNDEKKIVFDFYIKLGYDI